MTLIHTALLCEAMPIIEKLKLKKEDRNIYKNDEIILLVSGIGGIRTEECLESFLSINSHKIKKVINIGIAGCSDESVKIGELFCINKTFSDIKTATLSTVDKPVKNIGSLLVDMEAKYFSTICEKYKIEYLIFKVVSDHLDEKIPKKEFVSSLIQKSLDRWIRLI